MSFNDEAKGKVKRPFPKGFRIEFPDLMSLQEFRQSIWQDIHALDDRGVKYIKNGQLFLPITNEFGDPLILLNPDGSKPKYWTSRGYRSAAWDYRL